MKLSQLTVSPQNVRMNCEDDQVDALGRSIKEHSLISKLVLRFVSDDQYEVVAGQRRFGALKKIHGEDYELKDSEFVLMEDLSDDAAFLLSLQENQQRVPLSPLELNKSALRLNAMGYKDKEIAGALNVTPYRLKRLLSLSQNMSRLPEEAKQELAKPLEESKFNDAHVLKIKDLDDAAMVKDVVDYIMEHESSPKDVPTIVKAIQKQYEDAGDQKASGNPGEVNSAEPVPDGPIEYAHKGELKLEIHGEEKHLKVLGKGEEAEVPVDHYLEYLAHPEKFRCFVNFKLKIKPVD